MTERCGIFTLNTTEVPPDEPALSISLARHAVSGIWMFNVVTAAYYANWHNEQQKTDTMVLKVPKLNRRTAVAGTYGDLANSTKLVSEGGSSSPMFYTSGGRYHSGLNEQVLN